jgi:Protein of unknown function (DUF2752)
MSTVRSERRGVPGAPLGAAGTALAAMPVLFVVNPYSTHIPLCPLHAWTGLNCPLCGATRATYSLLHGDLVAALQANALYVVGIPFFALLWWRWYLDAASAAPGSTRLLPRRLSIPLLALVVAFAVLRNLPLLSPWLSPPS